MGVTTYPQTTGSSNVYSNSPSTISNGLSGGVGYFGGFGTKGLAYTATTIQGINNAAAALVAAGGGSLHLIPNGTYTAVAGDANSLNAQSNTVGYTPVGMCNIDTGYISFFGNRATVDISALGDGKVGFHCYNSRLLHTSNANVFNNTFEDLFLSGGDYSTAPTTTTGTTGILFHTDPGAATDPTYGVTNTSVRLQVERVNIKGCLKALAFRTASYCIRVRDSHIVRNRYGAFNESNQIDFAEKNVFENVVFGENYAHVYDNTSPIRGQLWTFLNCQFDYASGYNMYLNGAKAYCTSCHFEWNYGLNVGETNSLFTLTGANAGIWMKGGTVAYTGAGQNPYYIAPFQMDNGAQFIDLILDKSYKMGRLGNTDSYNAWVNPISGTNGRVSIRVDTDGATVTDVPSISFCSDTGQGAQLAHGVTSIYTNELINHIVASGTAVVTQVAADENGVTRKAAQPMMKITGQGKVLVNFPNSPGRRVAWQIFYATSTATSIFSGSVTIKERREGCAVRLDGTAATNSTTGVSLVTDGRAASYSPSTLTINAANATWKRASWQDCNTSFLQATRLWNSLVVPLEIDTTNMTAGAIYFSHCACDLG